MNLDPASMIPLPRPTRMRCVAFALLLAACTALAQSPPAPDPGAAAGDPLAPLAWIEGCWRGSVNQREFREQWMPLRGGLLLGVSQTVMGGKTQDYEYLRMEHRPDGVYYVAAPSGGKEDAFRLVGKTVDTTGDRNDEIFTFENPAQDFPSRMMYRRAIRRLALRARRGQGERRGPAGDLPDAPDRLRHGCLPRPVGPREPPWPAIPIASRCQEAAHHDR